MFSTIRRTHRICSPPTGRLTTKSLISHRFLHQNHRLSYYQSYFSARIAATIFCDHAGLDGRGGNRAGGRPAPLAANTSENEAPPVSLRHSETRDCRTHARRVIWATWSRLETSVSSGMNPFITRRT